MKSLTFCLSPLIFAALSASAEDLPEDAASSLIWYDEPATEWSGALPIGNGRLGAVIYGGADLERLQLNEDTLWSAGPHDYDNPDAYSHLAGVRKLLDEKSYTEAAAKAEKMMGVPKYQAAYQPLGELILRFPTGEKSTDYRRELDLSTAISTVSYQVGPTKFTRETFASYPDDSIVMHIKSSQRGSISFDLMLASPQPSTSEVVGEDGLRLVGEVAPRTKESTGARGLIRLWDGPGMKFAAQVQVEASGGLIRSAAGQLSVRDADEVTLRLCAATNYVSATDLSADPEKKIGEQLASVEKRPFSELRQRHIDDYSALYGRVEIDLDGKEADPRPTDELLDEVALGTPSPTLTELLFQYGRYLTIAGSRPGSQPLNLQGIWNADLSPPWGSKYTLNINTQMNYWAAEVGNLSECHEPLLRMVSELQEPGRKTAETHYRARGWMAHHNTDLWRGTAPVDGAPWGMWPTGGAWLCGHLWEHYLYTQDKEHLEKSYPLMKEAALFFLDVLVPNAEGKLVTSPSLSPEHSHGGVSDDGLSVGRAGVSLCAGPTMDLQIISDLFENCIAASEILATDEEFRAKITETKSRLAPMKIGRHGQLQEWQTDWDNPDNPHAHVSHLYGLFPSSQINPQDTPDLFAAAGVSLKQRGFGGGWPGSWRIALWARALSGENAWTSLTKYVMPGLGKNLLNHGRVFQIDANFGATAGVAEMLLQSHLVSEDGTQIIHLLPALPEAWPEGSVSGLKARGGFEVDFSWKDSELTSFTITSKSGKNATMKIGGKMVPLALAQDNPVTWDAPASN